MAKKSKQQTTKTKRAPAIHRSKSPSQVPPGLVYAAFALAMVILSYINVLSQQTMMALVGGVTLAYLLFIGFYQVYFKLGHKIVAITLAVVTPLWIAGCAYMIFSNVFYPSPVFTGELSRGQRALDVDLPSGPYSLFVKGNFKKTVEDASDQNDKTDGKKKAKKPRQKMQKGKFVVTMTGSGGSVKSKNFSGILESGDVRRKMSKKARGILHVEQMSSIYKFGLKDSIDYQLRLTTLEDNLEDNLKIEIYPRSYLAYAYMILGVLCLAALSFVDFLMKEAREFSLFSYCFAVSVGFAFYFYMMATPNASLEVMVMSLVVGAAFGLAVAVGAEYGLSKPFREYNRKKKISLL